MKSCVRCGEKNRDQANFCGHCGNSFSAAADEVTPAKSKTSRSVRCYECGELTGDVVRRNVKTGSSSGKGGSRSYYHKVSLCKECAERHDNLKIFWGIVVVIILLIYAFTESFKK